MYHVEKLEVVNCYQLSPDVNGFKVIELGISNLLRRCCGISN